MCGATRDWFGSACGRSTSPASAAHESCARHQHPHRIDGCSCHASIAPRFHSPGARQSFFDRTDEQDIVDTALKLWAEDPRQAPLTILDRAIARFERADLDFAFDADQLHFPHPFAELIRLAFAPQLSPSALRSAWLNATDDAASHESAEAVQAEWQRTIMCFADRYGLWLPLGIDEDNNPA